MQMATVSHHSWHIAGRADAGTQTTVTYAAPAPVDEYITPDPAVFTPLAPVNEYVTSGPVIEHVAPALVTTLLEPPVPLVHFCTSSSCADHQENR